MKHITLLLTVCVLLAGCAHTREQTIVRGIEYGMTPEEVVANLEPSQKIVSRDESRIVAEGYDSLWGMNRRNTFVFRGGKLVVHENIPARN